jgi:hypothetical protein
MGKSAFFGTFCLSVRAPAEGHGSGRMTSGMFMPKEAALARHTAFQHAQPQ